MLIAFLPNSIRYDLRDFEIAHNGNEETPKLYLDPIIQDLYAITLIKRFECTDIMSDKTVSDQEESDEEQKS